MKHQLDEKSAFKAMYCFLNEYYNATNIGAIGSLLGSLSLMEDEKPLDPAMWDEWLECVKKASAGEVDAYLRILDNKDK